MISLTSAASGPLILNREHPANKGLVQDWTVLPQKSGGGPWIDNVNHLRPALLRGNPTITGTARPGGYGQTRFNGTTQNAHLPWTLGTSNNFAVSLWGLMPTAAATPYNVLDIRLANAAGSLFYYDPANHRFSAFSSSFLTGGGWDTADGRWYHYVISCRNGVYSVYYNGVFIVSGLAYPGLAVPYIRVSQSYLENDFYLGTMDAIRVYNRPLNGAEAYSLYAASSTFGGGLYVPAWSTVYQPGAGNSFSKSGSASVVLTATCSETRSAVAPATNSIVATATASTLHATVKSASASVVITATAGQSSLFVYQKTASASVILTATASTVHSYHVIASASVILTATCSGGTTTAVGATVSVVLTVGASSIKGTLRGSSVRVLLRARARVPGATGPPAGDDYLGRYQQGTMVPLEIQCFQPKGVRALPDRAPVARMYRYGVLVGAQVLPVSDDLAARCGGSYLLGPGNEPGLYSVVYWYETGGVPRSQWQVFEVVPGGDMAGPVIAATVLERPDGDQVLAQFGSGVLAVGRDPYIDEGVL